MRFLLDTKCWMQVIREREHVGEDRDLIKGVTDARLATTDLSLHSIAIAMRRHRMLEKLEPFLQMSGIGESVELIRTRPSDLIQVAETCNRHGLDFEDAYQYVAAELNGLKLVSFDVDFDRTPNGRLTPAAALQQYKDAQNKP